jgi:hypothetical protein
MKKDKIVYETNNEEIGGFPAVASLDWEAGFPEVSDEDEVVETPVKIRRKLTNEDILKYEPMVEKYIRDSVVKNWNEASTTKSRGDVSLGNSGLTVNDIRQHLRAEVCVALQNFNPDYRTKEGRTVKESTFVFQHLFNRIGQLMKRLTKKRYGYGVWHSNIEETLWETDRD